MFFKTSKDIAIIGLAIALLIALQYVLSAVKGVELVTAFLLCFCFSFGVIRGVVCAIGFSLLRCFVFGFFPNVILLYLLYYPLFALVCGLIGNFFKKRNAQDGVLAFVVMIAVAVILTAFFTLLDNVITVIVLKYNYASAKAYFVASLPVMLMQCSCALFSTLALFYPITKVFLKIDRRNKLG